MTKSHRSSIDEEIESYNSQKFCHVCKKKFHNADDSLDSSDDSDDNNDKKFDVRKLHGDSAELDDIDHNYYEHNDGSDDDEFDTRKFHGDARALDDDFMVS